MMIILIIAGIWILHSLLNAIGNAYPVANNTFDPEVLISSNFESLKGTNIYYYENAIQSHDTVLNSDHEVKLPRARVTLNKATYTPTTTLAQLTQRFNPNIYPIYPRVFPNFGTASKFKACVFDDTVNKYYCDPLHYSGYTDFSANDIPDSEYSELLTIPYFITQTLTSPMSIMFVDNNTAFGLASININGIDLYFIQNSTELSVSSAFEIPTAVATVYPTPLFEYVPGFGLMPDYVQPVQMIYITKAVSINEKPGRVFKVHVGT